MLAYRGAVNHSTTVFLLLLAACRPPSEQGPAAPEPETGVSGDDTGVHVGVDTAVETVPGGGADDDGIVPLCQVVLECDESIPSEDKILCELTVSADGETAYDGHAGVETRGRSSSSAPKPGYAVELRDAEDNEQPANLFGMGAESDWVLDGLYYDRSLFRDALAYDLYRAFGQTGEAGSRWAPEHRFCELELDGQYRGVYGLVERVKRDDDRIVLPEDDGTGSTWVLKQDDEGGIYDLSMAHGTFKLLYPRQDSASADELAGVRAFLASWEAAVFGSGDIFEHVDLASSVDLVILEEFVKNNDAFYLSLHIYKEAGGTVHWVPWDLDLSLGQPSYNDNENPASWLAYRPSMIDAMADDPEFHEALVARWAELRAGPLAEEAITAHIDGYQATMGDAIHRNFDRWPIEDIAFGSYLYTVDSYEEEDEIVRAWIPQRLAWMDDQIEGYGN